eukprot:scaffold80964_cov57-Attheya_sp.AAC.5
MDFLPLNGRSSKPTSVNKLRAASQSFVGLLDSSNNCGKCHSQFGSVEMPCNITTRPPKHFPWSWTWICPSCGTSDMDLQTWIVNGKLSCGQGYKPFSHAPSLPSSTNGSHQPGGGCSRIASTSTRDHRST